MLKAFCDRCGDEMPDYDGEINKLLIENGFGHDVEGFDLCDKCGPLMLDQVGDFIRGA